MMLIDAHLGVADYTENGYLVVENVIATELIDELLIEYNKIIRTTFYYRSQSTNRAEKSILNNHGHLVHSILNPVNLLWKRKFF